MRSSTISMLIAGVLVGIFGIALGVYYFIERGHHKPWFFWIAPLLAFGFAFVMLQLVIGYWIKVGRLETKGRRKK